MSNDPENNMYSLTQLPSTDESEGEVAKLTTTSSQKTESNNSDEDGEQWKRALLARDLDMLHTCTLMIITDIPYDQRLQLSQNILNTLEDVKAVMFDEEKLKQNSGTSKWRDSLLARNLDLIETSLHIIMMTVTPLLREQLGRTIMAALQDLEKVVLNDENPADHPIHCIEAYSENNTSTNEGNIQKMGEASETTENPSLSKQQKQMNKTGRGYSSYRGPLPAPEAPQTHEQRKKISMEGLCPICNRKLLSKQSKCPACRVFALRMSKRIEAGYILNCEHKNYLGGVGCHVCRYHLYTLMMKEGIWR